jgi:uncharacterized protein (TIGR02246 family)
MRSVAPLCTAVLLFAAACAPKGETAVKDSAATAAPPVVDVAAVRQTIDQANAKASDAFQRGDTAVLFSYYDKDIAVLMAGQPTMRGKAEVTGNLAKMFAGTKFSDVKFNTSTVDVGGDYAIETGTYEMTVTEPGKKPVPDKGKYLTVWKKQADGSWKIYRDMPNSDGPPPKS